MKKKIDARIKTLIENCVKQKHRSLFVVVGDRGREQVVNLHYILSKTAVRARPSVLWCYKKDLGFSSNKQKRLKQTNKLLKRGLLDPDKDDPFDLFLASTDIRFCYYAETQKILGNTYGMCVLQDFEAMTPNILARTIETVEGGGIVVLLLRTVSSLRQLYDITMDVHSKFRTDAHTDVVPRFNERFLLSLSSCKSCVVVDDELNILPMSTAVKDLAPVHVPSDDGIQYNTPEEKELKRLQEQLKETQPVGALVNAARTLDQAKAVMQFVDAIAEKTLRSTVALTAARGRGKSAAMGLALAAAIAYGYSNIFVTSPSPENLRTFFAFVFAGFDALGYKEHVDYDIVQSTDPDLAHAVVRVNVFREHRQTIAYIAPNEAHKLSQAELVVVDEAAAIPLPQVKALLGPYLVFLASTVNGYEGTGRSLSLKLVQQLREQSRSNSGATARVLREVTLAEPIRYALSDPVESWLNTLLCLDASTVLSSMKSSNVPHPDACELYHVNRDTLFSFHKASEAFLQRMMALYVSSHYRNTPNDLQLMADAPGHQLFVLLGPIDPQSDSLPDVLCVVQLALEGDITRESMSRNLSQGIRPNGDLIPYTVATQFQDNEFARLSGGRVVRVATHPEYQKMGYGSRALALLKLYYAGQMPSLSEAKDDVEDGRKEKKDKKKDDGKSLQEEVIAPRKHLPPLLQKLSERKPETLHYLGVSYGLTEPLLKFWSRGGFLPVYLRQTSNETTGENTCVMLHALRGGSWLQTYTVDFRRRLLNLLAYDFRTYAVSLGLALLGYSGRSETGDDVEEFRMPAEEMRVHFTAYDLGRLEAYAQSLVDYHVIVDLLPTMSRLFFAERIPVSMSTVQAAIMLAVGLQHKSVDDVVRELSLSSSQVLALFGKAVRKITTHLRKIQERSAESGIRSVRDAEESGKKMVPTKVSLSEDLARFSVPQDDEKWEGALKSGILGAGEAPSSISIEREGKEERKIKKRDRDSKEDDGEKRKHKKHKH